MIRFVSNLEEKKKLCEKILRDLPEWFGIEEAIVNYIEESAEQVMIAYDSVGFVSLEETSHIAMDMHVLGVLKANHGHKIGKALIEAAESYAIQKGKSYMTVKTLSDKHPDINYKKTREFYKYMGYKALEEFPTLWGESNPCLYMIKSLESHILSVDGNIRLRLLHSSDYQMAEKWYSDPHILKFSEDRKEAYDQKTIEKMYRYLNGIGQVYIIEYFDEIWRPIGDVTLSDQTMPIIIDPTYISKGIGKKVIMFLLKRAELLGMKRVKLKGIYLFNEHSQRLFKSCGFTEIARDEVYVYMEKILCRL